MLITSPTPSEGKSTIAANLGIVLAQGGLRVTLIDADMRRPTIHKVLGTSNRLGLSSLFVQSPLHLNGSIQHTEMKNLGVLASGRLPPNPSELLGSRKMYEILDQIQAVCDIVLIDTPPVLSVTDAVVLAPFVDGVVLVIKPGATKVAAFKQAVERLRQVNARLLGVVVNVVGTNRTYYSYYYRNYYYKGYDEYTAEDGTKKKVKIKPEPVEVEPAQLRGSARSSPGWKASPRTSSPPTMKRSAIPLWVGMAALTIGLLSFTPWPRLLRNNLWSIQFARDPDHRPGAGGGDPPTPAGAPFRGFLAGHGPAGSRPAGPGHPDLSEGPPGASRKNDRPVSRAGLPAGRGIRGQPRWSGTDGRIGRSCARLWRS